MDKINAFNFTKEEINRRKSFEIGNEEKDSQGKFPLPTYGFTSPRFEKPGTCYRVVINDDKGLSPLFQKTFEDEAAFREFSEKYISSSSRGAFCSSLVITRANNLKNFAKDFFFPTVVNHAIGQDVSAIAVLGMFVWDFLTLAVRLLTLIPRVIYLAQKPDHPLIKELEGHSLKNLDSLNIYFCTDILEEEKGEQISTRLQLGYRLHLITQPSSKDRVEYSYTKNYTDPFSTYRKRDKDEFYLERTFPAPTPCPSISNVKSEQAKERIEQGNPSRQEALDFMELSSSATAEEIRQKFRQLSLKKHPDKGGDPDIFKWLSYCYEVLPA